MLANSGPARASVEEFLDSVARSIPGGGYNSLKYLLGDVGVGKTAFVNYVLSVALRDDVSNGNLWFIRLDIHDSSQGDLPGPNELCVALAHKVKKVIEKNIYIVKDNDAIWEQWGAFLPLANAATALSEAEEVGRLRMALSALIKANLQGGRRLFLVFDNLDFLCHLNDRGMFSDDEDAQLNPFLLVVHKFVGNFAHDGILGALGANILIVTRFDSYDIIRTGDQTDRFPKREDVGYYELEEPSLSVVYSTRKKLLDFALSTEEKAGKRKEFKRVTQLIQKHMESGPEESPRLSQQLIEITNHGFREVMEFFAQYAWIGDKDIEARLIHQYPVGLLTYMLHEWRRFSQMHSHFPNIYLVNIEQGEDCTNLDPYSDEHMHPHTYWLKWLIAKLIEVGMPYSGADYVRIFRGEEGDGYGEREIRKCLGSLAEANLTNMARAHFERNPNHKNKLIITGMSLTKRGKHCLEEIFQRFFYLQLLVDDDLLPIPRCIYDHFVYEDGRDYQYVTAGDHGTYWSEAKKMIKLKAKQVLLFMIVLEESLAIEMDIHASIFRRLAKDGVVPPDLEKAKEGLLEELRAISDIHEGFMNVEAIDEFAESMRKDINIQLYEMYLASLDDGD